MSRQAFLALENAVASPVGVEPDGSLRFILFSLRRSALLVLSVMSKWEDMLAEFRALGGIAENLCLKNGAFGRGLFPLAPSKPYKLHIPASLLIDINHVEFENDVFRVGPKAQIGERARSFLEGYERDFSWGVANQEVRDVLQLLSEAPQEIRELMRSPFNADPWLIGPHPAAVQRRYLASRALNFNPGIDVVIPIVELANHGHTTGYSVDENGVGFEGKTDGEILANYHPDDPLGMFVGWGFVSENERFACSLSLGVDKKGPPVRIMRKEVNLEPRPKPFMPDVTREGDTLILSFLMLGNRHNPQLPKAIFCHVMREAGRIQGAGEMFDYIHHINRLQWLRLMKASESAAVPLGQLLRNLAHSQLEAMSYNIGGLQF